MDTIIRKHNLLDPPDDSDTHSEVFEDIIRTENLLIEKIVSNGQITPEGEWYDPEVDEWILLFKGKAMLLFEHDELLEMSSGDYIMIPAHCRHRVVNTSTEPNCVWLAFHGKLGQ